MHIVCIYSIFGFVWPKKSSLPFLSVTLNHPSSLRIQMTWLHGPTVLAVRPPLSLSLSLVQYESVQLHWNQLICFTPELYLIVLFQLSNHASILMKSSKSASSCQLWLFNWLISKSFYRLFIPPNGLELNLMAVLCRCSWWQSRFPANFRPVFRQPVWQPQGVHRLQRSSRGAKPRKSYSLNCLLLFNAVSHYIEIMVEKKGFYGLTKTIIYIY